MEKIKKTNKIKKSTPDEIKKNSKEIRELQKYFQKICQESKPLSKLFKTNSSGYLYDTGTNKILKFKDEIFELIEKLLSKNIKAAISEFINKHSIEKFLKTANQIKRAVKEEKVLLTKKACDFSLSDHFRNYKEQINSSLEILFLEITENCNLRCEYCVYGSHVRYKRNHGKRIMSPKVLNQAIDYLYQHSFKNDKITIAFYGGEPLLEFPLIKSSLEYAKSLFKKKSINFSITTNATLLTPEIAEFFFKNNFSLYVSLDGPKEIHDSYRKDHKGDGSYEKTIKGLKNLIDIYGKSFKDKINLSMVYTPPFSEKRINRIADLWAEISWLPEKIRVSITYPGLGTIPYERVHECNNIEDKDLLQWAYERFWGKYTGKEESNTISDSIIESRLTQMMQRPVFQEPFDKYYLNGCCVPAVRRLYVSVDGTFRVCERISSDAPPIGNIHSGIDFDIIKKIYIDGYEKLCNPVCSNCWAARLCTSCYIDVFKNGYLDFTTKKNNCIHVKDSFERDLSFFCSLMEHDPKGLSYLYDKKIR